MERTFHMLLYRAFHAQRSYLQPYLDEIGLGVGQPKMIAYLAAHQPCRQKELSAYFEIDRAAVSRMLDSLEKKGFVTHKSDENNRRAELVTLTEKGKTANKIWQTHCGEMEQVLLDGFTASEREQFSQYLYRAYQNLKGKLPEEG